MMLGANLRIMNADCEIILQQQCNSISGRSTNTRIELHCSNSDLQKEEAPIPAVVIPAVWSWRYDVLEVPSQTAIVPPMLEGLFERIVTQILFRLLGRAAHSRWFVQWRLRAATGKKIAILVAKIDGDTQPGAIQEAIIDAVNQNLGASVTIYRWSETLAVRPGVYDDVEADLQRTAHRWLKRKRCDVLVWGRLRANAVVSLRFTPSDKGNSQSETYVLTSDTLELPSEFIGDLGAAIAATTTSNTRIATESRKYMAPALQVLAEQLNAATDNPNSRFDSKTIGTLLHCHALVMLRLFDQVGDRNYLDESISLGRKALSSRPRKELPDDWAATQNNVGTALARLGTIRGDATYFHQAIDALRASLEERSPDKSLIRWTGVQLNLACAFTALAEFEERDANLKKAEFIYDLIITPELRAADSRLWAITLNNYGLLLQALADKEIGEASLTRALDAFTEASEAISLEDAPFDWANLKVNLGGVLLKIGDRKGTLQPYQGATEQFTDALKVLTKERSPKRWAMVQNNLGVALSFVGQANANPKTIAKGISALENSLTVYDQSQEPILWRKARIGLGRALTFLGEIEDGSRTLRRAVAVLREVMRAIPRLEALREWQYTVNDLGVGLLKLGEKEDDIGFLNEARSVLEGLLAEADDIDPTLWVNAANNLGCVFRAVGELENDLKPLNQAVDCFMKARSRIMPTSDRARWALINLNLAKVYVALSERDPKDDYVALCHDACDEALHIFSDELARNLFEQVQAVLARLERVRLGTEEELLAQSRQHEPWC